jgi:hypothetical protein
MAATTELSDLPDLLLRRILYFAPAKEAASTTVLARRWRSLWLNSGAVNPDSRSYDRSYDRQRPYGFDDVSGKAEAFNRGMEAALSAAAAAAKPVRRLTLHVDKCCYDTHFFTAYRAHGRREHDMVRVLLASPAARAAEELAVVIAPHRDYPADNDHHGMSSASLNFGSLPSETLRARCTPPTLAASWRRRPPPCSHGWPNSGCGGAACPSPTSSASSTPPRSSPRCTSSATPSVKEDMALRLRQLTRRIPAAGWFARR